MGLPPFLPARTEIRSRYPLHIGCHCFPQVVDLMGPTCGHLLIPFVIPGWAIVLFWFVVLFLLHFPSCPPRTLAKSVARSEERGRLASALPLAFLGARILHPGGGGLRVKAGEGRKGHGPSGQGRGHTSPRWVFQRGAGGKGAQLGQMRAGGDPRRGTGSGSRCCGTGLEGSGGRVPECGGGRRTDTAPPSASPDSCRASPGAPCVLGALAACC